MGVCQNLIFAIFDFEVVHGLFKEPIIGPLKSKMAEIRHLENRRDVIFFCWGWSNLDKISPTGAEWHVDCGDMVKIETMQISAATIDYFISRVVVDYSVD